MSSRKKRAELLETIRRTAGHGTLDAITELLQLELDSSVEELEQAVDNISIWRAQGRAQMARSVIAAINPHTAA